MYFILGSLMTLIAIPNLIKSTEEVAWYVAGLVGGIGLIFIGIVEFLRKDNRKGQLYENL